MKKTLLHNEHGIALVFCMMALLILSLFSTAIIAASTSNVKTGLAEQEFQSAYYISEAGALYYMEEIKEELETIYDNSRSEQEFFEAIENTYTRTPMVLKEDVFEYQNGGYPQAEIILQRQNPAASNPRTYALVCKGTVDNISRTVIKTFSVQYAPKIGLGNLMTAYAMGKIELNGGASIKGPIGTNDIGADAVSIDGGASIEDFYLLTSAGIKRPDYMKNVGTRKDLGSPREYPLPEFPEFPKAEECTRLPSIYLSGGIPMKEITLTDDYTYISKIDIQSDRQLKINIGDRSRKLLVDDINIPQGTLWIEGSGNLSIYLRNQFELGGGTVINKPTSNNKADVKDTVEKLAFYIKASQNSTKKEIVLSGAQKVYGSLYLEDGYISLTGGSGFQGNIVTGGTSVAINGGAMVQTQMIYAPNASVILAGGGYVNGPIVSKNLVMSGGARLVYDTATELFEDPFFGGSGPDNLITAEDAIREK